MSGQACWTGAFHVLITERAEAYGDGRHGAFVNVVSYADGETQFRERVAEALFEEGYLVLEVDDVCEIDLNDTGFPDGEIERIWEGLDNGFPVGFGTFHTYPKEGLDA